MGDHAVEQNRVDAILKARLWKKLKRIKTKLGNARKKRQVRKLKKFKKQARRLKSQLRGL
ncbi:MAG: hypothetical protein CMO55_14805 [Verrucomicrobiales bacterium]|nr:hypothetical protein [Verrucomicrobiales bacterium]